MKRASGWSPNDQLDGVSRKVIRGCFQVTSCDVTCPSRGKDITKLLKYLIFFFCNKRLGKQYSYHLPFISFHFSHLLIRDCRNHFLVEILKTGLTIFQNMEIFYLKKYKGFKLKQYL